MQEPLLKDEEEKLVVTPNNKLTLLKKKGKKINWNKDTIITIILALVILWFFGKNVVHPYYMGFKYYNLRFEKEEIEEVIEKEDEEQEISNNSAILLNTYNQINVDNCLNSVYLLNRLYGNTLVNNLSNVQLKNEINTFIKESKTKLAKDEVEFKKYIESDDSNITDFTTAISCSYNLNLQIYKDSDKEIVQVNPNTVLDDIGMSLNDMQKSFMSTDVFMEMFDSRDMNEQMYDLIAGSWPEKYNEVILLVDEYNEISDYTLYALGLKDSKELKDMYNNIVEGIPFEVEQTSYNIDDLVGMKFKFLLNSDYYIKENGIWVDKRNNEEYMLELLNNAEQLTITGIIKPNEEAIMASTTGGILYLKDLKEYVINKINESSIAKEQVSNPNINVFTGKEFSNEEFNMSSLTQEQLAYLQSLSPEEMASVIESYKNLYGATYDDVLNQIGIIDLEKPTAINIYPKDFDSKEEIINIINNYNEKQKENNLDENVINYSDLVGVMMSGITTIIDVISYVLMAFVSISLVVSSIMIGIITYISVLERTKEIGILRAIGASKKDISRVFNAETFIEGLTAGVMGILITLLLTIPINIIIKKLANISNIAVLPVKGAIILVIISVVLTIVAGLIPARMASKKDPVEALRVD